MSNCRWDREAKQHLRREHRPDCAVVACQGCLPCCHDDDGNPVRHCRVRTRCTSHLRWGMYACEGCLSKIRGNLTAVLDALALMPDEAAEQGIDSEPANLAGPHADWVTAQWRLVNAARAGQVVEELDMRDPYTCLTMHERYIREHLGHDEHTLVSPTVSGAATYLDWALTDLARDEEGVGLLGSLLGDTSVLRSHVEAALRDSRAPERGVPCPECVTAQAKARENLEARGVPREEWPQKSAPRLQRSYGHWCLSPDCRLEHYLDDSGDWWKCPAEPTHKWRNEDYQARLVERRKAKSA